MQSEQHVIYRLMAGRGLTWKKLTEEDCHEWKLTTVEPQERSTWRSGVRPAMSAASQLPERGPTDVADAPAHARQKSDYDMMLTNSADPDEMQRIMLHFIWVYTVNCKRTHLGVFRIQRVNNL